MYETYFKPKIRRYSHFKRMNTGRMQRQALEYRLEGKRPRGQPRYRWEEQVKKNVVKRGIKWMEMEEIWKGREKYSKDFCLKLNPRIIGDTRFDEREGVYGG